MKDVLDRDVFMLMSTFGIASESIKPLLQDKEFTLSTNKFGESALMFAIKRKQWDFLKNLGESIELQLNGPVAMEWIQNSARLDQSDCFKTLDSLGIIFSIHSETSFFQELNILVVSWTPVFWHLPSYLLDLHFNFFSSNFRIRKTFSSFSWLQTAPNVNLHSSDRRSVFHYATHYGAPGAVEILLKNEKINVNAVDEELNTPLHLALSR